MLTFKNKEEEEFWKQTFLTVLPCDGETIATARNAADIVLGFLRVRQPVQQFPEVEK